MTPWTLRWSIAWVFSSRVLGYGRGFERLQRWQWALAFGVDDIDGLHALPHMSVEVAKEMPKPVAGGLHGDGNSLARIDGHGADVLVVLPNIVAMPVHDVSVETHVPDVPDSVLVLAHLEWRAVGVYIAIELVESSILLLTCCCIDEVNLQGRSWAEHQL